MCPLFSFNLVGLECPSVRSAAEKCTRERSSTATIVVDPSVGIVRRWLYGRWIKWSPEKEPGKLAPIPVPVKADIADILLSKPITKIEHMIGDFLGGLSLRGFLMALATPLRATLAYRLF